MKRKDTSSYAQGDVKRVPHEFVLGLGRLHQDAITVHHYMGSGDAWFVTCRGVNIERQKLVAIGIEDAKAEAITVVQARVDAFVAAIRKATEA